MAEPKRIIVPDDEELLDAPPQQQVPQSARSRVLIPDDEELLDAPPSGELVPGFPGLGTVGPEYAGIDVSTGGDLATRFKVGLAPGPEQEAQVLEQKYGPGGYRQTAAGEYVVPGEGGRERLLSPKIGDPARIAGEIGPEVVGGVAAGVAGTALGAPAAAVVGLEALGGQALGALSDVTMGGDPREALKERSKGAALDLALGGAAVGAGKAGKAIISPLGKSRSLPQVEALKEAERALQERAGLGPDQNLLTLGQRTGSSTLLRIEAIGRKLPLSTDVLERADRRIAENMTKARSAVGGREVSASDVGQRAVQVLEQERAKTVQAVQQYKVALASEVESDLDEFGRLLSGGEPVNPAAAVEMARRAASFQKAQFDLRATQLYDLVDSAPGGDQPIIPAEPVRRALDAMLKEKPTRAVPRETGLLDAQGRPIVGTQEQPFTLQGRLVSLRQQLEGLNDMTPRQARNFRQELNEIAADPNLIGDATGGSFKNLSSAISGAIESGKLRARSTGNEELADALDAANDFYKESRPIFSNPKIQAFLKDPNDPGAVKADVFARLISSNDTKSLRELAAFFGPDSPEWRANVGAWWSRRVQNARSEVLAGPGGQVLTDAGKLANDFTKLDRETRRLVFGDKQAAVFLRLRRLEAREGKIPAEYLNTVGPIEAKLKVAEDMAAKAAQDFENRVVAPFLANGDPSGLAQRQPSEFVRYIRRQKDRGAELLGRIDETDPALGRDIRSRLVQDLFESAQKGRPSTEETLRGLDSGYAGYDIDGSKLDRLIRTQFGDAGRDSEANLAKLLGEDQVKAVRQLAVVIGGRDEAMRMGSLAGGMAASTLLTKGLVGGMRALPGLLRYRVLASMVTGKSGRLVAKYGGWWGPSRTGTKAAIGAGGMLLDDLRAEFAGEPELYGMVLNAFGTSEEQLDRDRQLPQSVVVTGRR